jgi:hypothetical protein
MDKLVIRTTTIMVTIFLVAATFGVQFNRHAKNADMPAEIRYEILSNKNIWPDRFYTTSYSSPEPRSFYLNGYWTFEHNSHPFAGPVRAYHPFELTITDSDFKVNPITTQ